MARIAIVSRGWWPTVIGGSEKFMYRLGEQLYRLGHEVVGITRRFRGQREPKAIHRLIVMDQRIKAPIVSSYLFSRWAAKTVNRIKPDIAIVNSYWGELAPIWISREIKVVSVIHDIGFLESSDRSLGSFIRVYALRKISSRSDAVVVPTSYVRDMMVERLKVDDGKIAVLGFEGVDGPFKPVYVDNGFFDIVHVARFSYNKGQHISIEAFRRIVDAMDKPRLWLVGGKGVKGRDKEYLEDMLSRAESINREYGDDLVNIVVDAEDLDQYYSIADVCVFPSIGEEGYGLTPLECLAYGKPVVISEVFTRTSIVDKDIAYIVPANNPDELAKKILHIYRHLNDARSKALKAMKKISQYSWNRVGEYFDRLIRSL